MWIKDVLERCLLMIEQIPVYLKPYIAKQDPSLYTAMDHATWRYILKVSQDFLAKHTQHKYLDGLRETGVMTERIPLISEMDQCLRKFGWQAVPVVGFIPSEVFMEFLSLGVLPIACDMRTLDHIAYTPAPDIVHEAAGHAPIIIDSEYRDYLKSYGEVARKAIFSSEDFAVYQAIRTLSDLKEDAHASLETVKTAEENLDIAIRAQSYVSEATFLSRMGWWTFEYGLIGSVEKPKIYDAGLLSSLGESFHCFDPQVKKIPFSTDCIQMSYDITRPQPQLYVARSFQELKIALRDLADAMAFRKGGVESLQKALKARTVTTTELDSGLQISGVLTDFKLDSTGKPFYIRFGGPTQISYQNKEIEGQGADYHREGFSTPLSTVTETQVKDLGLRTGRMSQLKLESGVVVEGKLDRVIRKNNHVSVLTFTECTVTCQGETLFRPEWGNFDLVSGKEVVSVFGGAADRKKYLEVTGGYHQEPARPKTNLTPENSELNELYARVREIREGTEKSTHSPQIIAELVNLHDCLEKRYPDDWLLRFELLELGITGMLKLPFEHKIRKRLFEISQASKEKSEIIQRGLGLL